MPKFHPDEFDPGPALAALVIEGPIQRLLARVAKDADHRLSLQIHLHVKEVPVRPGPVLSAGSPDLPEAQGEGRIRFRRTFSPSRILYCFDARFTGEVLSSSGFSGFHTAGEVRDEKTISERGWTGIYNDQTWTGWHW